MKENLLMFDGIPEEMKMYLSNYGFHFNKKACDFAVSKMKKKDSGSDKKKSITPWSKSEVDDMLTKHGITLENDCMYDATYVANMLQADSFKSSLEDEKHLVLGIKDVIDDVDMREGTVFVKWYAACLFNGCPIDWSSMI